MISRLKDGAEIPLRTAVEQNAAPARDRYRLQFGMGMLPGVRSRGLGTLLLDRLIASTKDVPQLQKINLRVIANDPRAMGLYRMLAHGQAAPLVNSLTPSQRGQ